MLEMLLTGLIYGAGAAVGMLVVGVVVWVGAAVAFLIVAVRERNRKLRDYAAFAAARAPLHRDYR